MKRRSFLRQSALSSLAMLLIPSASYSRKTVTDPLLLPKPTGFPLEEFSVTDLQKAMKSGQYSSKMITQLYLDRIASIDKAGPAINSVIEINPDALAIAEQLDAERKAGKVRGPLHGIPVLIKDNINTADKMMTTAGSLALEGHRASEDAFIVSRLREAGAVVLGKTNLSEWANFRSTKSSSGWSSRGGQTKNPYGVERNPCGSSSGSGAAVTSNFAALAIGTETNGSIACPSSINGVVGIKPTVGLWSRTGIIPISHTQDTAGPMTRSVSDAAILLGALTGTDREDEASVRADGKTYKDYTTSLKADGLKGKRIGVEKTFLKVNASVDILLAQAIETMKAQGAEIIEVPFLERVRGVSRDEFEVLLYEFKHGINAYFKRYNTPVKTLADVIAFNTANSERAMPHFKQEILEMAEKKGDLQSPEYKEALERLLKKTREGIDNTLKEFSLHAICGPTNGPSWCTDWSNGDRFSGYGMYSAAAIAGYPSIQVPMGLADGLPVGLTFFSTAFSEGELISLGYAYEQGSRKRVVPMFGSVVCK